MRDVSGQAQAAPSEEAYSSIENRDAPIAEQRAAIP
jgi:hypothetical protein